MKLDAGTIEAANVRPAFETSLHFGATEDEIERATGLHRAGLVETDVPVTAEATYAHMELMFGKPGFAGFLLASAQAHGLSSLGIVGLACKTVSTVGEAMACHQRFQHLTNRTARYTSTLSGDALTITEERFGPPRLGSLLVSDYTMLIAVHLLRQSTPDPVPVLEMRSRRRDIPSEERTAYEDFIEAPIRLDAARASVSYGASISELPVPSADAEMAAYFRDVLTRAARFEPSEDALLTEIRLAIRDALVRGAPNAAEIARRLGLGQRTLQRRLSDFGHTFTEMLESTRRALAEGYLADDELSLAEIAYLLGYREQTSFFRAFRRWHDTTPAAYRQAASG